MVDWMVDWRVDWMVVLLTLTAQNHRYCNRQIINYFDF